MKKKVKSLEVQGSKLREVCGYCMFKIRGKKHEQGDHHNKKVPLLKGKK